jgi:hypothetical protein
LNTSNKYLGIIDESKNEQKHLIQSLDDIYKFADQIKKVPSYYE